MAISYDLLAISTAPTLISLQSTVDIKITAETYQDVYNFADNFWAFFFFVLVLYTLLVATITLGVAGLIRCLVRGIERCLERRRSSKSWA